MGTYVWDKNTSARVYAKNAGGGGVFVKTWGCAVRVSLTANDSP